MRTVQRALAVRASVKCSGRRTFAGGMIKSAHGGRADTTVSMRPCSESCCVREAASRGAIHVRFRLPFALLSVDESGVHAGDLARKVDETLVDLFLQYDRTKQPDFVGPRIPSISPRNPRSEAANSAPPWTSTQAPRGACARHSTSSPAASSRSAQSVSRRAPRTHPPTATRTCTRILLQAWTSLRPRMHGSCDAAQRSCASCAYRAATPLVLSAVRPSKRLRLKTASRRTRTAQRTTASTRTSARHRSTRARATPRLTITPRTRATRRLTTIPTRPRLTPPAESTLPAQITPRSPTSIARRLRLPGPVSRGRTLATKCLSEWNSNGY